MQETRLIGWSDHTYFDFWRGLIFAKDSSVGSKQCTVIHKLKYVLTVLSQKKLVHTEVIDRDVPYPCFYLI